MALCKKVRLTNQVQEVDWRSMFVARHPNQKAHSRPAEEHENKDTLCFACKSSPINEFGVSVSLSLASISNNGLSELQVQDSLSENHLEEN